MSSISIFTAVKYINNLENFSVTGWCAKQLDNWTFPFFDSKIEVIEFDKGNASDPRVARYQENTTKSSIGSLAFRILLLTTIIFPFIVLITRAIIRRKIEFKKIESSAIPLISSPKTAPEINQSSLRLLEKEADKESRVSIGKSFSIELQHSWSTGHDPWMIFQIPSFINYQGQGVKGQGVKEQDHPPGFEGGGSDGGGSDYVFTFKPNEPGKGNIVMQLPCSFDPTKTVEKTFTIIAE